MYFRKLFNIFANIYLNIRPIKQDKEALSTEAVYAQNPKVRSLLFPLVMRIINRTVGSSDGANPVMRYLKGLQVRACEIRGWKEACCYSIGSKGERRSIEYFFFALSAYI